MAVGIKIGLPKILLFPNIPVLQSISPLVTQIKDMSSLEAPLRSVQDAICTSINNNTVRVKELVVALEWSKNEAVLGGILT